MKAARLFSTTALTAAALAAALPAHAQSTGAVEEIVVTARKTSERLQDVPIAITAFTAAQMEERGQDNLFKISQFTPGFSFEKANRYGAQGGATRPVIRGMSNILGDGNAAVFVDGILFSDNILSFPFDIVERVEVIKGPQSALFGRSTFSGAINLITKRGTNDFQNEISGTVAEYGNYEINALSRGPIIADKLFYVGQARYYKLGAQYNNTIDGKGVGQEESYGANGSFEYRASDAFTATLNFGYNEDHDGLAAVVNQDRFSNNCYFKAPRQYYCGEVKRFEAVTLDRAGLKGTEGLKRNSKRLMLQLEYDAGPVIVTSNTGAYWTHTRYGYDSTYQGVSAIAPLTIPSLTGISRNPADPARTGSTLRNEISTRHEWSEELRIRTPDANRFRVLGGAFFYQKRRPLIEAHMPGVAGTTVATTYFGTDRVDNFAVFGSAGYSITDAWTITGELRWANDKVGNSNPLGRPAFPFVERKFKSWSPRITTNYKVSDQSMVYATVARGNKPGVINADPRLPVEIQFATEESSWNYEIGTKNTFMDGRVLFNLSAYYIDWKNQQLTTTYGPTPTIPTTINYIVNAGRTHIKGFESELQVVLNENLTVGATYAMTDAKFVAFNDPEALQLFGNASVAGKQLPNQPKNQATTFAKLQKPLTGDLNGFVRVDVAYNDRKYDKIYNLASTGEQYLMNLRIGIDTDKWNLTAFVDNLLDDRTPSTVIRYVDQLNIPAPATGTVASTATLRGFQFPLADKRRFGVTGKYKF